MGMMETVRPDNACMSVWYVPCIGFDGKKWNQSIDCGKCSACLRKWSGKVYAKINAGLEHHGYVGWKVVLLSWDKGTCDRVCLLSFRNWRNSVLSHHKSDVVWFRVFEHTKAGTLHVHMLIKGDDFPYVPRRGRYEKVKDWYRRLDDVQKKFSDRCKSFGLGPYVVVEDVHNSKGMPRYMAKYMSKGGDKSTGIRYYGNSRNWAPKSEMKAPLIASTGAFRKESDSPFANSTNPYTKSMEFEKKNIKVADKKWSKYFELFSNDDLNELDELFDEIDNPPIGKYPCECGCGVSRTYAILEKRRREMIKTRIDEIAEERLGERLSLKTMRWLLWQYECTEV